MTDELVPEVKERLKLWDRLKEAEADGASADELRERFEDELGWFDCTECDWHGPSAPMADDWSPGSDKLVECPNCGGTVETQGGE